MNVVCSRFYLLRYVLVILLTDADYVLLVTCQLFPDEFSLLADLSRGGIRGLCLSRWRAATLLGWSSHIGACPTLPCATLFFLVGYFRDNYRGDVTMLFKGCLRILLFLFYYAGDDLFRFELIWRLVECLGLGRTVSVWLGIWAEGIFLHLLLRSALVLTIPIKIIEFTKSGTRCALVWLDPATISATCIKLIVSSLLLLSTAIPDIAVVFKCRSVNSVSSCTLLRVF